MVTKKLPDFDPLRASQALLLLDQLQAYLTAGCRFEAGTEDQKIHVAMVLPTGQYVTSAKTSLGDALAHVLTVASLELRQ